MKSEVSRAFVFVLAIVSILGFCAIVSTTLFEADIGGYVDSLMIIIIGVGLLFEVQFNKLASIRKSLNQSNFATIITFAIAIIAILTGILSLPIVGVSFHGFLAIKGILSILAIIIIVIQTWIVKN